MTPKTLQDRIETARVMIKKYGIDHEVIVDPMSNELMEAFTSWPERLYVINKNKIEYHGGPGPFWFSMDDLTKFLHAKKW